MPEKLDAAEASETSDFQSIAEGERPGGSDRGERRVVGSDRGEQSEESRKAQKSHKAQELEKLEKLQNFQKLQTCE